MSSKANRYSERMSGRGQFIVSLLIFAIMAIIALWLMWVQDTGRWQYEMLFAVVVAFITGIFVGRDSRMP